MALLFLGLPSWCLVFARLFPAKIRVLVLGVAVTGVFVLGGGVAEATNYGVTRTVLVHATVTESPPGIELHWPLRAEATEYRLTIGAADGMGSSVTLPGNATGYVLPDVVVGQSYDCRITMNCYSYPAYGHVYAGVALPLVEDRGAVILMVDGAHVTGLSAELSRLEEDLGAEGWRVYRHDLPLGTTAQEMRELIVARYAAEPDAVKAVFLLGSLPVAYSGVTAPDGHYGDHQGAWPCDLYFGDLDVAWTDYAISSTTAARPENRNIPGDWKFDQVQVTDEVELAVGRVDLSDLPSFAPLTEEDLLRRYLDKNHAFRRGHLVVAQRALVDDHLSMLSEAPAGSARRAFHAFFGSGGTVDADWGPALSGTDDYLWAYGGGYSSYTSIGGVGSTADFASRDTRAVFTMVFGSYFGDWDNPDNVMRAVLAAPTHTLTTCWSGRPQWMMYRMGLGETIGEAARRTQGVSWLSNYQVGYFGRYAHVALLGDPTLRMHPVAPPSGLAVQWSELESVAELDWEASPGVVEGYHVDRQPVEGGEWTRLTPEPVADTEFVDTSPSQGGALYRIRAVRREVTGSGSFWNGSGVIVGELAANFPEALGFPEPAVEAKIEVVDGRFAEAGPDGTAIFRVTRTGSLSEEMVLGCSFSGKAGLGSDFLVSAVSDGGTWAAGELTVPAGIGSVDVTLTAVADDEIENREIVVCLLGPGGGYSIAGGMAAATLVLEDRGFDRWRLINFGAIAGDPEHSDAGSDEDGDGLTLWMEYVLGANPKAWDRPADMLSIGLEADGAGGTKLACSFQRHAEGEDAIVVLESSLDLVNWEEEIVGSAGASVIVTPLPNDGSVSFERERVEVEMPVLSDPGGKRFYRARVRSY